MKNIFFLVFMGLSTHSLAQETHYYMTVFATEPTRALNLKANHTFATFTKTSSIREERANIQDSNQWNVENFTISWLAARLPICLLCRPEMGYNYSLPQTLQIGYSEGAENYAFPTIEVTEELYTKALYQFRRLNSGGISYVVNDRRYRPDAVNCLHAVVDVDTSRGYLMTGLSFGIEGSRMAYNHLAVYQIANTEIPNWLFSRLGIANYPIRFTR